MCVCIILFNLLMRELKLSNLVSVMCSVISKCLKAGLAQLQTQCSVIVQVSNPFPSLINNPTEVDLISQNVVTPRKILISLIFGFLFSYLMMWALWVTWVCFSLSWRKSKVGQRFTFETNMNLKCSPQVIGLETLWFCAVSQKESIILFPSSAF